MTNVRVSVNVPAEKPEEIELVDRIIDAMAEAGAGTVGRYERVALVIDGRETWRTGEGAHPYNGRPGEITSARTKRIEMRCPSENLATVVRAIRRLHPYEEPVIEIARLEDPSF